MGLLVRAQACRLSERPMADVALERLLTSMKSDMRSQGRHLAKGPLAKRAGIWLFSSVYSRMSPEAPTRNESLCATDTLPNFLLGPVLARHKKAMQKGLGPTLGNGQWPVAHLMFRLT